MDEFYKYLKGGDLRSIAKVGKLIALIKNQADFDKLFRCLYSEDRLVVMRAADAIEKITVNNAVLLAKHKKEVLQFLESAKDKEFKWHLALMVARLDLSRDERIEICDKLSEWVRDEKESKIVRVHSLQALFDLARGDKEWEERFNAILIKIKSENIPSLNARIRKLEKQS